MTTENLPVLVGVDTSDEAAAALDWAVTEARLRQRPLWVVHAYAAPVMATPMLGPPYHWQRDPGRDAAQEIVDRAVAAARRADPQLPVSGEVAVGVPGQALAELAGRAYLVVVGSRGRGGFAALLLGSVSASLAAHAPGPVVVVRPSGPEVPAGGVVVGVDGSVASHGALGFAFEQADLRGLPLRAVHVWQPPGVPARADLRFDPDEIEAAERHQLEQWLRPWRQKFPEVPATGTLATGHPAGTLVEWGAGATLLVIGARGRGAFTGLLGSVSQQVIHHATGPLAVVR